MSKKREWFKRISIILVLCMVLVNGNVGVCFAEDGESYDPELKIYINGELPDTTMNPGDTKEFYIPIVADVIPLGGNAVTVKKVMLESTEGKIKVVGTPILVQEDKEKEAPIIGSDTRYIKCKIHADKKVEAGTYKLQPKLLVNMYGIKTVNVMDTVPIYIEEKEDNRKASIQINNIAYSPKLSVGQTGEISFDIENTGDGKAADIHVSYDGFSDDGLLPDTGKTNLKIATLGADATKSISLPVKVSENAVTGAKKITITVSYKKENAQEATTETENIYIEVKGKKQVEKKNPAKAPKIVLKGIKQSDPEPQAGGFINVSFLAVNEGTKLAKNITITPSNLSNTGFSPASSDPSVYIKSLKAGGKVKVTMAFNLSKKIESGLNELDFAIAYKDGSGADYTDTKKTYIRNVKAKEETNAGVPKLIIQKYGTTPEVVKAGKEFTFNFDVYNTHSSLDAENIKVTITSEDGTFSVAKGSNSFYIKKITPGSVHSQSVPLKVKADSTTKSYPIKVQFEYEYKGMQKPENTIAAGLTVDEVLNIQVEEDSRPALTNILPGAYGELIKDEVNTVTFDFTNRGKSPLYNVEVVIKGDFVPTQEVYFIGGVAAGSGSNHEMEITPTQEGLCEGTIIVTYEDSNGKEGKIKQKFTGDVMPGGGQGGEMMGEEGMPGEMMPDEVPEAKKPILSTPLFILLQVILFFAGMIIVKKVRIAFYKKKLRKLEENE